MFKQAVIGLAGAAAIGVGFAGSAEAATLFEQTDFDPTNTTSNATAPNFTIYDDFVLSENSILTDITYKIFQTGNVYKATEISIFDGNPETVGNLLFSQTLTGNLTANGTQSNSNNFRDGFDVALDGLNVALNAGTYYLGLSNQTSLGAPVSIGSGDTGIGDGLIQDVSGNFVQRPDQLTFALEGTTETESVPEPASILGLVAIGAVAAGGALKKKAAA